MIAEEIALVARTLELTRAALAKLLSVDPKTVWRWEHGGLVGGPHGASLIILRTLAEHIERYPASIAALRAFAHMSVARGGLPHFLDRCLTSHLNADQKG